MPENATNFLEKVNDDIAIFRNSLLNHVNSLLKELEGKDLENRKLKQELTILESKYKALDLAHAKTVSEFNSLKEEMLSARRPNKDIVFLSAPENICEYPDNIQDEFFHSLQRQNVPMSSLLRILDYGLSKNRLDVADKALVALTDFFIKPQRISEYDWAAIVKIIIQYVNLKAKSKSMYSIDALFHFFVELVSQGKVDILRGIINSCGLQIEEILIWVNTIKSLSDYGICLLELYFFTSLHDMAKSWIEQIKHIPLYPTFLDMKGSLSLLFISLYYGTQKVIYSELYESEKISECPEVKCYRIYSTFCRNPLSERLLNDSSEVRELAKDFTIINPLIKDKVINEMLIKMQKATVDKPIEKSKPKIGQSLPSAGKNSVKIKRLTEIYIIKKSKTICPSCFTKLSQSNISLAYYDKKGKAVQGYVEHVVLYCPKCTNYFIDKIIQNKIEKSIGGQRIKIKGFSKSFIPKETSLSPTVKQISNQEFKWPTTAAKETTRNSTVESDFREESELHKLGYKITGLKPSERWEILQSKAIPTLGLEKTVKIIANNIKMRKRQKNGIEKYSHAISQWEHDLNRLEREYGYKRVD